MTPPLTGHHAGRGTHGEGRVPHRRDRRRGTRPSPCAARPRDVEGPEPALAVRICTR
ncbi:hypothetical protein SFR_4536 [Streptomyces sp. FR-008]|nr:hypothetical protein SFR_4536 [Streptomyces sp. FR-008]